MAWWDGLVFVAGRFWVEHIESQYWKSVCQLLWHCGLKETWGKTGFGTTEVILILQSAHCLNDFILKY